MDYDHRAIEKRWQEYWEQNKTFKALDDFDKPKFYALDMFPYPSGNGLHVGHPEGYTATDIISRVKRMKGFNVLHPMGWDAFGLPAEQHAINTGTHPATKTRENVDRFRDQLKSLGFSYDWDREINTTDPKYYRWTQWIFLQLYKRDLAYIAEVPVNWCPALGTVLANEEVIDGRSERGNHEVIRKPMRQWMLKITAYAERLLDDLEELDWPESIKKMQRDWIGKSIGAEADFKLKDGPADSAIRIYTTRPDTLFGATYMVLAPEHPLVDTLTTPEQAAAVNEYREQAARKSDLQRTDLAKEKTGVFTGGYALNPVNGAELPVWVADYVLISYGTGAIMAVPGHDTRDYEFAKTFDLPIVQVIAHDDADIANEAYVGPGTAMNSGFLDGLEADAAKEKVTAWLEDKGLGQKAVNYKLRDWLFSRQRYWGEPFPVIHTQDGGHKPIPEEQLPLRLPEVETYKPTGTGESPLAAIEDWVNTTDPDSGAPARRETNTMPQWAGSCWYYLRFIDPDNDQALIDPAKEKYWMPVDLYVGGAEHAVLHLLYARFWHKVLYDAGVVSTKEPFHKLVNQGMILGFAYRYFHEKDKAEARHNAGQAEKTDERGWVLKDAAGKPTALNLEEAFVPIKDVLWKDEVAYHPDQDDLELEVITEKMSKSRGNVINPDDVVEEYGADTLRLYEMFMGPLEQVKPWNTKGVVGLHRFLAKLWRLVIDRDGSVAKRIVDEAPQEKLLKALHRTIKKVSEDTEALRFNTAIAAMMELLNALQKTKKTPREAVEKLILILSPYAPHACEELWQRLGHENTLAYEAWPDFDEALCVLETVTVAVQVNGKMRGKLELAPDEAKDAALAQARELENVRAWIEGKDVVREIYVPGRIVNLVVKG